MSAPLIPLRDGLVCLLIDPVFKAGDQPPKSYLAWHEWAAVQTRAGLRQRRCPVCKLYNFPQETCCDSPWHA